MRLAIEFKNELMHSQISNNTPRNPLSPNGSGQARGDFPCNPSKNEFPSSGGDRGGQNRFNNDIQYRLILID